MVTVPVPHIHHAGVLVDGTPGTCLAAWQPEKRMYHTTIWMVTALADHIHHAGLLVGGTLDCILGALNAERSLLHATVRVVAQTLCIFILSEWLFRLLRARTVRG